MERSSELKPKQWFVDRIGKAVYRDTFGWEKNTGLPYTLVMIHDELQAQYMFDMQNDLFHDNGINLNYRKTKQK